MHFVYLNSDSAISLNQTSAAEYSHICLLSAISVCLSQIFKS